MIKGFIEHLGIKILRTEGNQYVCQCPWCDSPKLYINQLTGLWDCKHGCGEGNPYKLIEKLTNKTGKDNFTVLEQFNLGTDAQSTAPEVLKKPKRIWLRKEDIKTLPLLDQLTFCQAKQLDRTALLKLQPYRHAKEPWVLLPAFNPENPAKACGWIRVGLDGRQIELKSRNEAGEWETRLEKYPVIKGSSPGLVGLTEALKDTSGTIIYAEGWKDAHAVISQGFISVCNSQGAKTWRDEWLSFFKDKTVYIVFDCDKAGVSGAKKAANKIATVAKEVYNIILPYEYTETNGKDLYDYIIADKHDFSSLLKTAPVYIPTLSHNEPEPDIKLPDDGADTLANAFRKHSIDDCQVIHRYHPFDGWTIYVNNQYQKVDAKQQIAKYMSNFLHTCWFKKGKGNVRIKLTNSKISDVISQLSYLPEVYLMPSQKAPCWLDEKGKANSIIAAKNCLINLKDGTTMDLTDRFYTTNYLPYDYNKDAISEKWGDFLLEITDNDIDMMLLLQMWCGYLLMPTNKFQKFLLCVGDGANGKFVFFDTIAAALGKHNVSNVPLACFSEPYKIYSTYGKIVNMSNENAKTLEANTESTIKEYTGGDKMLWEQKYKDVFSDYPTAKLMFATNILPVIRDTSDGIWRRMIYVPFDVQIPESKQNKSLSSELQTPEELAGILNWMLEGRQLLIKNNGFVIPDKCNDKLNQYRMDSNSALGFINENIEEDTSFNEQIISNDLYLVYKNWCASNGCYAKNNVHFGKELSKQFPKIHKTRIDDINGKRVVAYKGIKYKSDVQSNITSEDYEAL